MNYIFEIFMKMIAEGKNPSTICFRPAQKYSPYLELSRECLNEDWLEENQEIEINPYFRYHAIFKDMFPIGEEENLELKQTLMDILIHINFETDRYSGMDHHSFYIVFLEEALRNGAFGRKVKNNWKILNLEESRQLAQGVMELYFSGEMVSVLKETLLSLFPKAGIYFHFYRQKEIMIYTAVTKNNERVKKIELLKELFLPIDYELQVYWKNHFGIIGIEETMMLNQLELY